MNYIKPALEYSWVWISLLIIAVVYWYGHLRLSEEKQRYASQYEQLHQKFIAAKKLQKSLNSLIQHKDNPILIEWTLMNHLGLIPEGTTKIIISKEMRH